MEGAGLLTIAGLLVVGILSIPINLARAAFRISRKWRGVPLVQRNHTRAGVGAFALVAIPIYIVKRGGFSSMFDIELYFLAASSAFAAIWLVVGVAGSRLRYDPMQIFWLGVLGLGAVALLVEAPVIAGAMAGLVATIKRVLV